MIAILGYGSGNVQAIKNIYDRLNITARIVGDAGELARASKLILPGVGAFDTAMDLLTRSGLREPLDQLVLERGVPVLGVCVGMQIMASSSEEGHAQGLNWIDAVVKRLDVTQLTFKPTLPHMGWNQIRPARDHDILRSVDCERGFYFLHSFAYRCHNESDVLAYADYGAPLVAAVNRGNIFGFQFHPEKSHQNGIAIFRNFAEL